MDHQIKEAVVLAGGLGTRLGSVIEDAPKPLAPIKGTPFLHFVFAYLKKHKIEIAILSVGYKWEMIREIFGNKYLGIQINYVVEEEPLGTGGGIRLALQKVVGNDCFVLNGDTYFDIDLKVLEGFHFKRNTLCTLGAKRLENFDRYGTLDISNEGYVLAFREKQPTKEGVINGGIYCLKKDVLEEFPESEKFSFEMKFLEMNANSDKIAAKVFDDYFKDIGIPDDYEQFQKDLESEVMKGAKMYPLKDMIMDKTWTLFLDRDGVLNERLIDNYVKQLNELKILEKVPEAIAIFSQIFNRIVVVTNQQGIGKGRMDEVDLEIIHGYMNNVFKDSGGNIDKFYFAPQLASENSNLRKPGIGMGLAAKNDFPEIAFSRSLMIGDSESDVRFGMNLGMKTIMLTKVGNISTQADYIFDNLYAVATELKTNNK